MTVVVAVVANVSHELVFASLSLEEEQTVPAALDLDLSSRLRFHSAFLPEVTSVNPKSIELSVRSGAKHSFQRSFIDRAFFPLSLRFTGKAYSPRTLAQRLLSVASGQ